MGISIREALQLDHLAQTRVIAGKEGLDRIIRWVNILEVLDEINFLQEGELLITTAFGLADNPQLLDELIPFLAKRNLAGLAIQTGYYLKEIPANIIKQCDEYKFPLLELPPTAAFNEITRAILKKVVNTQVELLEYAQNIHQRFTHVVLKGEGFTEIAGILAELIDAPVRIFDRNFNLLAYAKLAVDSRYISPMNMRLEYQTLCSTKILSTDTVGLSSLLIIDKPQQHIPAQVLSPLITGSDIYGYISVLANSQTIGDMDLTAITSASTTCTLEMLKEKAVWEAEERISGDFLDDLMEERFHSKENISRRANYLGYDLNMSFSVLCFDIDNFKHLSQIKSEPEVQEIKRRLLSLVRFCFRSEQKQFLLKYKGDKIIALLQVKPASGREETFKITEVIRKAVNNELPLTLTIGIGSSYADIKDLPKSFREAQQAVEIGKKLSKTNNVLFYDSLLMYRLFTGNNDSEALLCFFNNTVASLYKYDQKHNSELVNTLETFLHNNSSIKETAERMFIHRHSLRYRLNRITEITGLNPEKSPDSFQLQLGLLIAPLLVE